MAKRTAKPAGIQTLSFALGANVPHFTQQRFKRCVAHLELMWTRYLREVHTYSLDGSTLVFVYFGPHQPIAELTADTNYTRNEKGNWSAVVVPKFDGEAFFDAGDEAQDQLIMDSVQKALLAAAKLIQADVLPIKQTYQAIVDHNFSARFAIAGCPCKAHKTGLVASVYSCVVRGAITWEIDIQDAHGSLLVQQTIPQFMDWRKAVTENQLKLKWDKQEFKLIAPNGKTYFAVKPK